MLIEIENLKKNLVLHLESQLWTNERKNRQKELLSSFATNKEKVAQIEKQLKYTKEYYIELDRSTDVSAPSACRNALLLIRENIGCIIKHNINKIKRIFAIKYIFFSKHL